MRIFLRWTSVLSAASLLVLLYVLIAVVVHYEGLMAGEGWGMVAMIGIAGIAVGGLLLDLVLRVFIKDRRTLNVVDLVVVPPVLWLLFRH